MNLFRKILGKKKTVDDFVAEAKYIKEDFLKFSDNNRILILMKLGDRNEVDVNAYPVFRFAILSDVDKNVKFAALKRIHLFKDHPDMVPLMSGLMKSNTHDNYEPYFSMALSRLGLISTEDFEKRINKS